MNWYEENIEPQIRNLVKLLRDNGFNTECSCEHEMYIQCQYFPDGSIKKLHDLLFNEGYRNYVISIVIKVINGCQYQQLRIDLPKGKNGEKK